MVPEGLVLLTSIAFVVAAVTLARRKVLVQELPAVEGLARVDVVCLDKTGTLTEGEIVFDEVEPLDGGDDERGGAGARRAGRRREPQRDRWSRSAARFASPDGWTRTGAVPFSSARKWSAASFDGHGLVGDGRARDGARRRVARRCGRGPTSSPPSGRRVLVLAHSDAPLDGEALPAGLAPVALVMFAEKVRPDAAETLRLLPRAGRARSR